MIDKYGLKKSNSGFLIRFCDGLIEVDDYEVVYGDFSLVKRLR